MTFGHMLDAAHVLWAEQVGVDRLDRVLHEVTLPPDEGMLAQARLDAMLAT